MVAQTITIKNEQGLHMRPAGVLSKAAAKYPCDVKLISGDKEVNAKSIQNAEINEKNNEILLHFKYLIPFF